MRPKSRQILPNGAGENGKIVFLTGTEKIEKTFFDFFPDQSIINLIVIKIIKFYMYINKKLRTIILL